jgi:hypothetical protein
VPEGCGLVGVRTTYRSVRIAGRGPERVVVAAVAQLAPSELRCAGRTPRKVPGTAPRRVRIELVHTRLGVRIAGQRTG